MEMVDTASILHNREAVWKALNDPEGLRRIVAIVYPEQ